MIVVIMGPSGVGKSTIGKLLSSRLNWEFFDGDDFHSAENIDKIQKGIPLDDNDREAWLRTLAYLIKGSELKNVNAIVACSALKRNYREKLGIDNKLIKGVFLTGSQSLLTERLTNRKGHFAKIDILKSQLEIQQIPENCLIIDTNSNIESIISQIITYLEIHSKVL